MLQAAKTLLAFPLSQSLYPASAFASACAYACMCFIHWVPLAACAHLLNVMQAINSDSCVPDGYAQTNAVEDYAQVTVAWIYLHASGSLPSPGGSCMQHQLDALSASTANGIQNFKTKADQRNLNSLLC